MRARTLSAVAVLAVALIAFDVADVRVTQHAESQAQMGGGPSRAIVSGGVLGGSGTTANPTTATLSTDSTIGGTGSQGSAFYTSGVGAMNFGIFGDCSDGNGTIAAGTSTATRDLFYADLTVQTGGTLVTAGYRIFVCGTLDIQGTGKITGNGGNGAASTAGVASAGGFFTVSGAGGAGQLATTGTAGSPSAAIPRGCSTAAAAGGAALTVGTTGGACHGGGGGGGGANIGGAGGVNTGYSAIQGDIHDVRSAMLARQRTTNVKITAGSGGGGGAGVVGFAGGGGGGGGGYVMVAAKVIVANTGTIEAKGGNGGNGNAGGNTGGGGGGGGGVIILVYGTGTVPTMTVTGGTGGTKGGTGGNGGNGGAGIALPFPVGS